MNRIISILRHKGVVTALCIPLLAIAAPLCAQHCKENTSSFFPPASVRSVDGVLRYPDGREVNLWGVNFQPSLSWEYAARMERSGLLFPLSADKLKATTMRSFDQLERLGVDLIRIHVCPADFFDGRQQIVNRIWLDMLDFTMAEANKRKMAVYLTLINEMKNGTKESPPFPDCFTHKYSRAEWMFVPKAVEAGNKFIHLLLNRSNPYDENRLYKKNPALLVVEPINEPHYPKYKEVKDSPLMTQVYGDWLAKNNRPDNKDSFSDFRYTVTQNYLNSIVALFRAEGVTQPVVWNVGWPRLIQDNREIFRAIADSAMDAVSFCLYPGQDDLKLPVWKNTEELSQRNYLPYLQRVSDQEDWMGWLRTESFKGKAKLVYEYETFCNQSSYLYPQMARLMRSLGAQAATLWTYGLEACESHLSGTHVFNLNTTPAKAVSFLIGGKAFKNLPRGTPFVIETSSSDHFAGCAVSYALNLAAYADKNTLFTTGSLPEDFLSFPKSPSHLAVMGNSPFVSYGGTGIVFLDRLSTREWRLLITPNVRALLPHWQESNDQKPVWFLDRDAVFPIGIRIPAIPADRVAIERLQDNRWISVPSSASSTLHFNASPGTYRIIVHDSPP